MRQTRGTMADMRQKNVIRREPVRMALAAPAVNDPDLGERKRFLGLYARSCELT